MHTFRVLTFVTDDEQYAQMRATFAAAGFSEENTAFVSVDNTAGNRGDPYSMVNPTLDAMIERYLIVCHQDIRLDPGSGYEDLVRALDAAGDRWGVAGPAGISLDYRQVLAISDPWNAPRWEGPWPVEVEALDELLIVIHPGRARLTAGLVGFHFYGVDLCLSAARAGWTAVAIDFPLTHLSDGRGGQNSLAYRKARDELQVRLSPLYWFTLAVSSTGEGILLSRSALIRRYLDRARLHEALKRRARRSVGSNKLAGR